MTIPSILVIDDDNDILNILESILNGAGYKVTIGRDVTAVYEIEKDPPSLLLIDNWLSGNTTGHDICYRLKKNPATAFIPVILISATNNLKETAERCGADGFIAKPFDVDQLLTQVKKSISVAL